MQYQTCDYDNAVGVTPSDTETFKLSKIFVGGTGNITVKLQDGRTRLYTAVAANTTLPVLCIGVMAAGTAATDISRLC